MLTDYQEKLLMSSYRFIYFFSLQHPEGVVVDFPGDGGIDAAADVGKAGVGC
jgi:hypothetical protein